MGHLQLFCLSLVLAVPGLRPVATSSRSSREVLFGLMTGDRSARAGVESAINDVNERTDLLSDFTLKIVRISVDLEDECNEAKSFTVLHRQLFNSSRQIVSLIGSGCPATTELTAKISQYYNITMMSCTSLFGEVSDCMRLPNYFQLLPSEVHLARVFYSIIKEYGWRKVAIIVQNEQRYRVTSKALKTMLSSNNEESDGRVEYLEMSFDTRDGLGKIKNELFSQARISVAAMDSKFARELLCVAFKSHAMYPKRLLLLYGSYEYQWWRKQDVSAECSEHHRAMVLQYSLAALHYTNSNQHLKNSSHFGYCQDGMSQDKFHEGMFSSYTGLDFYHQCYDAVMSLALSLNKTTEELKTNATINRIAKEQSGIQSDNSFDIANFNYNVSTVSSLIKEYLGQTCFTGSSGPVRFDENGVREITSLRVLQYRTTYFNGTPFVESAPTPLTLNHSLRLVDVAYVNGNKLRFPENYTRYDIWPSVTPHDGLPDNETATVIVPVAVVLILFDVGGLAFAAVCLVFNLVNRNKKLIRLTSPNLNYMIITGTVLVYLSGISFALPLKNPFAVSAFCFLRSWLLVYGFTCGFAPIVAKMWRVYYIFRNPQGTKFRKSGIQDWHLILFVCSLLVLNTCFMFLHILLEGVVANFNAALIPDEEKPSTIRRDTDITVNFFVYQCSSHIWIRYMVLAIVYGYMLILQMFALYFAFQTRKIKVKGLNDAKYIAMIVYVVGILIIINVINTFALPKYVTVYAAIYSTCIWLSAAAVLGITFVPKMVRLYNDPEGETVFTAHEEAYQVHNSLPHISQTWHEELASLKRKVEELKDTVVEYKRITGISLTKESRLTTSVSMINLSASTQFTVKEKTKRCSLKVNFKPRQNKMVCQENTCEDIID